MPPAPLPADVPSPEVRGSERRPDLTRFAWLSVGAAVITIGLKTGAYLLTGSVGLLSDAAESVVNLVAAFVALIVLHVAARPPDEGHNFGHTKAEYFSAAVEGVMIFVAAVYIIVASVERLLHPQPLENVGIGLGVSIVAAGVNGAVALVLIRAGRRHRSITLEADGRHLFTDVWTSGGVLVGVVLVVVTGWLPLDPIVGLLVGANIIWTGWGLVRRSVDGLMDRSWDPPEHAALDAVLTELAGDDVQFHEVRTRESGHQLFVTMHVLVPDEWTVRRGHDLLEGLEDRLHARLPGVQVTTHLEPLGDARSYHDGAVNPASRPGP